MHRVNRLLITRKISNLNNKSIRLSFPSEGKSAFISRRLLNSNVIEGAYKFALNRQGFFANLKKSFFLNKIPSDLPHAYFMHDEYLMIRHILLLAKGKYSLGLELATLSEFTCERLAAKLAIVFGKASGALDYLRFVTRQFPENERPFIDNSDSDPSMGSRMCFQAMIEEMEFAIQLPARNEEWTFANWQLLANKHKEHKLFLEIIPHMSAIDHLVTDKTPIEVIIDEVAQAFYKSANLNPSAANLSFRRHVSQHAFDHYIQLVPCEDAFLMPDIHINGAVVDYDNFYIKKLYSSDPIIATLDLNYLVRRSVEEADWGIYVIKNTNDEIVARTCVWRGEVMHFIGLEMDNDVSQKMVSRLFGELARQLVLLYDIPFVDFDPNKIRIKDIPKRKSLGEMLSQEKICIPSFLLEGDGLERRNSPIR